MLSQLDLNFLLYVYCFVIFFFFFSSRRRHTRCSRDWSSDVCSSDLVRRPGRERSLDAGPRAEGGGLLTTRLTPLALSVVTLAAWGLVLGVFSGRPELVVAVAPLLLGLLRRGRANPVLDWRISRSLSVDRAFEGERVVVPVPVNAGRRVPLLELFEPLPPSLRVVAGSNRSVFTLVRGQEVQWRYEVECQRRGRVSLGAVRARLWDRAGLYAGETSLQVPGQLRVYPRPIPLRRLPRPRRTQASVGNHVSSSVGEGLEPGDIREFVPGDRIRHVNWRASLRFRRLFVTQYHPERHADVILMLDTLVQGGAPPETTLDASIQAAASLGGAD